jgi:uncharacterized protein (DUF1501 family)
MSSISRRAFLRHATALGSLGAAAPLGLSLSAIGKASAQSVAGDYKALVCLFLYGGNDAWTHYNHHRNPASRSFTDTSPSLALTALGTPADPQAAMGSPVWLGGVHAINSAATGPIANRSTALHPMLAEVVSMHNAGRVAVLANVGPLIQPLSKADYAVPGNPRPSKLFSHNDQQSTWQSFSPEGADGGWGGRMGDLLMSRNGNSLGPLSSVAQASLTCISPGTPAVWMTGQATRPLQVGSDDIPGLSQVAAIMGNAGLQAPLASVMNSGADNLFAADHQAVVQRAINTHDLLSGVLPGLGDASGAAWSSSGHTVPWTDPRLSYTSPLNGLPRHNPLAAQLQMVARLIDANRRGQLGMQRQVFMVSLGGFDTHANQNAEHADRMAQLNHALTYFDDVLSQMPLGDLRSQVTTFTASDFGRSFTTNGDGTDHGWGGHHFIMGGAVKGGEVYGTMPQYATANAQGVFDSPDLLDNGIMLPSTSVDQYAYTLGHWMGVSNTDLLSILPNLTNFNASTHDLGFMG